MPTIYVAAERRAELEAFLDRLPAILAGEEADHFGIAHGFRMRVATAFFSLIKEAFIVKSRGGTDAAGIKWPPLSAKYLAYQRPHVGRSPPKAGGKAPGGKDGFMSDAELKRWRADYSRFLAHLAAQVDDVFSLSNAKSFAAALAWKRAKERGVRTKLEVFGKRPVEILRDRGILFNSLSPGVLVEAGTDANYSAPSDQIVEDAPGLLYVGTSVSYAGYHQNGKRKLWPDNGELPELWVEDLVDVAASGLQRIGELISKGEF